MSEKFVMVSLEEHKAKKIAEVLSNDTARKILDYLTEQEEASESEIAKALQIPLSTVHYNIKNLLHCHFVESKEFKWSAKGKHVDIYKLAKKYVIITPKATKDLREKLKTILPAFILSLGGAGAIYFYNQIQQATPSLMADTTQKIAQEAAVATAPALARETINVTVTTTAISPALWFLMGAWLAILTFLIYTWRSEHGK